MKSLFKVLFLSLFCHIVLTGQTEVVVEDIGDNGINFLTLRTENPAPSNIYLFSDGIAKKATVGTTLSGYPITFQTNDGEKLRITDSGRLGMGTTTPARDIEISNKGAGNTIIRLSHDDLNIPGAVREIGLELYSPETNASVSATDWRIMNRGRLTFDFGQDQVNFDRIFEMGRSGSNIFSLFSSNVGIGKFPGRVLDVQEDTDDLIARFAQTSQGSVGFELVRQSGAVNNTNRDWQILNDDTGIFTIGDATDGTNYKTQFRISPTVTAVDTDFSPLQDNVFDLGSATTRWENVFATNPIINTSDIREKKNITEINYGLETINKLNPVSYYWKQGDTDKKLGLIAQEVFEVIPDVVNVPETEEGLYGISYTELIPVLIQSVKELSETVKQQETRINELESKK